MCQIQSMKQHILKNVNRCVTTQITFYLVTSSGQKSNIPYFIEYSVHFYALKMMLKYTLCTTYGR